MTSFTPIIAIEKPIKYPDKIHYFYLLLALTKTTI